jgi:ankyrin repeat protein
LSQAYDQAIERIHGQKAGFQLLAKKVLSWITFAKRPLTTLELQHAIAVEIDQPELDEDNLPEIEDMVFVCAGLVTVDEESNIIRLLNPTIQEYFDQTQKHWFSNAEIDIATTCVTYLSFDTFGSGFCQTDEDFEKRLRSNILYDYAARNWGHHACAASTVAEELIVHFLENEAKVSACSQAMMNSGRYSGYSQRVPRKIKGEHLVAYFGLRGAMNSLLNRNNTPDVQDSYGRTPLSWASGNGHKAVVKLLLGIYGVDPDSKDSEYRKTPLSWAADRGHDAVVRLLLANSGVNPDDKDAWERTPLSNAAENGHEAVVKLLLATDGVDPDSKSSKYEKTPLSWAAQHGHVGVVKLLLANSGVNADSKDAWGRTPLSYAAENGDEAVVKLLLATDNVDPDCKDSENGRTPLFWASENGHEVVVKLFLEKIFTVNTDGSALLKIALADGYKNIVERLLTDYFDNVAQENFGWLLDLRDAGFKAADITSLLLKTVNIGPWVTFERSDIHSPKGKVDIDMHQPSCVHTRQSKDINDGPPFSPVTLHLKRNEMQTRVATFCGIAGAFPPLKNQLEDLKQVSFEGMKASVIYNNECSESKFEDYQDAESDIGDAVR